MCSSLVWVFVRGTSGRKNGEESETKRRGAGEKERGEGMEGGR
jgi:hypothetical protein